MSVEELLGNLLVSEDLAIHIPCVPDDKEAHKGHQSNVFKYIYLPSHFSDEEKDKSQEVMKVKEKCGTALTEQLKKDYG